MCVLNTRVTNNEKLKHFFFRLGLSLLHQCLSVSFALIHAFFKETDIIAGDSFRALRTAYLKKKKKATMTMNDVKEIEHLEGCDILYCIYCSHNAKKKK